MTPELLTPEYRRLATVVAVLAMLVISEFAVAWWMDRRQRRANREKGGDSMPQS